MPVARRTPARPLPRTGATLGAALGATALLAVGLASPAAAHVSVTPSDTGAGAYAVLTFSVPHGCDGSPTTTVAISVPDGVNAVTPTRSPFYELTTTQETLDEPITGEGGEITERTSVVTYAARTALPDGERDTFELSLQLPEDGEGETLAFPVVQTCEDGETAWTEVPTSGESEDELDHPAPAVIITAPVAEGPSADTDAAEVSEVSEASAAPVSDDGDALGVAGLVAGLAGLLLGGLALARTRRTA